MARPRKEVPFRVHFVPSILRYLRAHGGDPDDVVRKLRLPPDAEEADDCLVTASGFRKLLEEACEQLKDPTLCLRLPGELERRKYTLGELLAGNSRTLGEALERVVALSSSNPGWGLNLQVQGKRVMLSQRFRDNIRGMGRCGNEFSLASLLMRCRRDVGATLRPLTVCFTHVRPRELGALAAFFGTDDLCFGATVNCLVFDRSMLDLPLAHHDPKMVATVEALAQSAGYVRKEGAPAGFAGGVAQRVRDQLPEVPTAEVMARQLRLSPRTFHRRLKDEGTGYQQVVDRLRAELARDYVADPALPLDEIAYRLGFSELSTFIRAFRRWTGTSPGAWRREHHLKPPG